jgi:glycosyltransferase involved in cell wall biosynthesis
VTAACLLMPRTLFQAIGGFDERTFGVAYNDVDLCYRLVEKGYRCVYSAGSELVHHEGLSRGFDDKPAEEAAFKRKYGHLVDPYYNANLSLDNERFDILPRASELRRPARPIRALMVAFNLNLEGAPYSQYELTVGLKRLCVIDPVVFCPEDGPLRALYEAVGIEVIHRPHPLLGVFDITEYEAAIGRFSDLVRQCSAQVVYGNTLQTFYAIDAANRLGLPSIWNPRESEPWQTYFANFGDPIACKALQCFQFPYRVVFVSDATRQGCERLNSRNNFMTIHNGLDPARAQAGREKFPRRHSRDRLGLDEQDLMVLLLGTVCERKGQIDLVDAARRLAEMPAANRLKLFIVGDREGAYSTRMHNAVDLLPPHQRARMTIVAETRDAALYLSAADIFVCTSRVESYPRVILEAMFYGHAIVTTAVFGIAEQLSDRISALFYTTGDANKLAGCLERIATDDALRTRLSDNAGLRLARLTSFDEMLQQYADCFSGAYYAAPRSQETDHVHPN